MTDRSMVYHPYMVSSWREILDMKEYRKKNQAEVEDRWSSGLGWIKICKEFVLDIEINHYYKTGRERDVRNGDGLN